MTTYDHELKIRNITTKIKTTKEMELEIKVKVAVWFAINDIMHQCGVREESMWNENDGRDIELMNILDTQTLELTKRIMEIIKDQGE